MIPTLVLLGMLVLLALGTPVGFALLIAGTAGLLAHGGLGMALGILKTSSVSAAGSYELISIPMFMLMAEFVILSGVADSLFRAASTWVGRLPGGLGIATTLAGAGFAEDLTKYRDGPKSTSKRTYSYALGDGARLVRLESAE
jgi:TRAP-type mannitol/chloroaromatic compound transport system permease large subunit